MSNHNQTVAEGLPMRRRPQPSVLRKAWLRAREADFKKDLANHGRVCDTEWGWTWKPQAAHAVPPSLGTYKARKEWRHE